MLQTDAELDRMAARAADVGVEVSLFARPCAAWGISAASLAPLGAVFGSAARGSEQLIAVLEDIQRAADHGIRSVLVSDLGVLASFGRMRARGELPGDMQAKVSVMLPVANPASAEVLVGLGADTLNLQTDLSLAQIASIRSVVDVPLDIYVEAPDSIGGFLRYEELAALVRVAAPVYLKFGLRNAPEVYPSGSHLDNVTVALTRERVRRARIGLERMARAGMDLTTSEPGASGLAVPQPRPRRTKSATVPI
ncbi:U32 family peptidase [Conexibacter sp. S30A1]|uniref:U32 family peptidase n=1 Tax=Conexibacter sp. S30A1 TaxID=2937800 RepID=UPI0020100DDA|nr:U32 family peptidase [Conexibacter sp. S30A1]